MSPHHEHEFEAAPGLPEPLPVGERILWQGAPQWGAVCVHAFHMRKIALYFGILIALQIGWMWDEPVSAWARPLTISLSLSALSLAMLAGIAWLAARTALYTLTSRRVVMRIGIVLCITLNLPLRQIRGAAVLAHRNGHGDIALALAGKERIGWLHLWPHARPWHLNDPQPMLRGVRDVQTVADKLLAAWQAVNPEAQAVIGPSPATASPTGAAADAGIRTATA
ncbi:MAG: PH domain-containing protein [Betaproteobacteria bacterium]|jgi:Bacterial PH domain|nr:PH domain-containing protein [Betaproteobacteria bacterium]NBS45695.1 PH domain-containing protein [Betaproteobacteria bacterium]